MLQFRGEEIDYRVKFSLNPKFCGYDLELKSSCKFTRTFFMDEYDYVKITKLNLRMDMSPLIIDVSDILKVTSTKKEFKFDCEFKPFCTKNKLDFISPVSFDFFIENIGLELLVKGNIKGRLRLVCNRCLSGFEAEVKTEIDEVFLPVEGELDAEETFKIIDNKIDLRVAVEQAFLLELPMKLICKKGCKGLCSKCGQNLNLAQCNCLDEKIDVRLLKLKKLKEEFEKKRS